MIGLELLSKNGVSFPVINRININISSVCSFLFRTRALLCYKHSDSDPSVQIKLLQPFTYKYILFLVSQPVPQDRNNFIFRRSELNTYLKMYQ